MGAIFFKEVAGYFNSLTAYVTIGIFLIVNSLLLWVFPESSILEYGYAGMESFFNVSPYIFMFLVPAITMRLIAEERRDGTFELLATRPLSDWQILLGKFLAANAIIILSLAPTLIYYLSIYKLGAPEGNIDSGAVFGSYTGLLLLGAAYSSIGLFTSSISSNQIIAFLTAVFVCFFFFSGFDSLSGLLSLQTFDGTIRALGVAEHYQSVGRGVIDSRDLAYFFSLTCFFLLLTKLVLGGRKW